MSLCVHIHVLKKLKGKFLLFILQQGYINIISTQNLTQINIKIASSGQNNTMCLPFYVPGILCLEEARVSALRI